MLSHSAVNHCVENTADFFEKGDMAGQVSLGVLPLFHGFSLAADIHRNIRFGSQLVMMPRWNPRDAVKLIKRHRVTLMVGVPAMYYSLLREPGFRGEGISQLSYCYTGGDNVNPDLIEQMDVPRPPLKWPMVMLLVGTLTQVMVRRIMEPPACRPM